MPGPEAPSPPRKAPAARSVAILGWTCLAVWLPVLAALSVYDPRPFAGIWLVLAQQLIGGRALGIATGLSLGIPKPFLIAHCALVDMILIMVLYPLLILGVTKASRLRLIGRIVENARRQARRYAARMKRYGSLGLSLFVMAPVWSTGPMSGTVVGHLMGLRTAVALTAVAVGNTAAITGWTLLFDYIQGLSEFLGKWLPVALLVLLLGGFLVNRLRKRRPRESAPEEAVRSAECEVPGTR